MVIFILEFARVTHHAAAYSDIFDELRADSGAITLKIEVALTHPTNAFLTL